MTFREQAKVIIGLPVMVTIVIPLILLNIEGLSLFWLQSFFLSPFITIIGFSLITCGLGLLVITVKLFARIGKGTLAPWAPPKNLVVTGIYQYIRNPMILGVLIILLGESIIFLSFLLFSWFLFVLVINQIYFIKIEEPGLIQRFGSEYLLYMANVPRWIPRRKPWNSSDSKIDVYSN